MHLVTVASVGEGQCRATARVQCRLPGAKTTQVEAHMATCLSWQLWTDDQWQAALDLRPYKFSIHARLRLLEVRAIGTYRYQGSSS